MNVKIEGGIALINIDRIIWVEYNGTGNADDFCLVHVDGKTDAVRFEGNLEEARRHFHLDELRA